MSSKTSKSYSFFNFTQVCRGCKKGYQNFKIDLSNYDEDGKNKIQLSEIYGKFSFICCKCRLLNLLNFDELCSQETILFLKKRRKEMEKANL